MFWTDIGRGTIERVGVDGRGREIIREGLGTCVQTMTLDYASFTIYWIDKCLRTLESVMMDGVHTSNSVPIGSVFTDGISILGDYLYWADTFSRSVRRLNRITGTPVVQVSQPKSGLFGGIEVVHPSKQPNGMYIHPPPLHNVVLRKGQAFFGINLEFKKMAEIF